MVSLVTSEVGLGSVNINVSLHPKAQSPHAMYPSGPFVKECPGKSTMTPEQRGQLDCMLLLCNRNPK